MTTQIELLDEGAVAPGDAEDGIGCLRTAVGNLPLESVDVRTRITGLAAHTEVTQGFRNGHTEPLEATYVFPLPPRAAVTAMRMEADGRVIEGLLKERGQARADYDQAMQEGKRASIAEEERPGVFTMRVGNVMPGERVTVHLTLAAALPYEDGEATFRFPLVVAPRYIPGEPIDGDQVGDGTALDTDAVPDASRISPPVLLPGFPNPVRLSLEVDIDPAGLPVQAVRSSLHAIADTDAGTGMTVKLNPGERADRDFILRLRIGDDNAVSTSLAVLPDEDGGTFALTVLPPAVEVPRTGRDVVLVLDRSGSMGGWKMVAARRAAARIVDTLTAADRFAVLAFDYTVDMPRDLPKTLAEATDRNRFRAVEFLAALNARGGTEMLTPLRQAANLLSENANRERVVVLVTDGQIGNEDQILAELAPKMAGVRVHTVGIDRAVNEGFLQRLAGSQGRAELVESEDRLDEAMHNIHRRIGTPLITDLSITGDGLAADLASLAPQPLPDLYAGAPVVVLGRFTGTADGALTVAGKQDWRTRVAAKPSTNPALAALWARLRIRDLEDRYVTGETSLESRIVETSLKHGVLSRFTAFVAVDQRVVNEGGERKQVTQPVDLPSGWDAPEAAALAMPRSAPAGGATFAAAASFDGMAFGGSGYGSAPPPQQGGAPFAPGGLPGSAPGWQPPVIQPPIHKRRMPMPVPPGDAPTLRRFVADELNRLRGNESGDVWHRAGLLTALSERIRVQLSLWAHEAETARTALAALSTELAAPTADPDEVERRWQHAITTLTALASDRSRKPFWKR